jgi:hypothetical protein
MINRSLGHNRVSRTIGDKESIKRIIDLCKVKVKRNDLKTNASIQETSDLIVLHADVNGHDSQKRRSISLCWIVRNGFGARDLESHKAIGIDTCLTKLSAFGSCQLAISGTPSIEILASKTPPERMVLVRERVSIPDIRAGNTMKSRDSTLLQPIAKRGSCKVMGIILLISSNDESSDVNVV